MLKLLLDEHISPEVATGIQRRNRSLVIPSMVQWESGNFIGKEDSASLLEAAKQRLTLVTYDRRTIPPLLKLWAEEEQSHGGRSLLKLAGEVGEMDWTDQVYFLRSGR